MPEIGKLTGSDLDVLVMTCVVVPRSGEDDAASGEVFPSVKNQGIEPEGGPCTTTSSAPTHKKTNLHTQRDQGVVNPLPVSER